MRLSELYKSSVPALSFEVFPPKPDVPLEKVTPILDTLKKYSPDFVSVTYGAGGSSRGRTVEIASKIRKVYGMEAMAHLTCVGQTHGEVDSILEELKQNNICNVLALRGDPPRNNPDFDFSKGEFKFASELITYIRSKGDFSIAAAAYVEGHRNSRFIDDDWKNLKRKVECGVDVLITQLFYDNRLYFHFRDSIQHLGVKVPVVPGIMPLFNAKQMIRVMGMCGASMPPAVMIMLDKYGKSEDDMYKAGIDYAVEQIQELVSEGVPGIHIEPMNRPELAEDILKGLSGLRK